MLSIFKIVHSIIQHFKDSSIATKHRHIYRLFSGPRRIISSSSSSPTNKTIYHGKCKLDSHADTIVAGRNCVVLNYVGKECDVTAYRDDYEAIKNVPIANVATA